MNIETHVEINHWYIITIHPWGRQESYRNVGMKYLQTNLIITHCYCLKIKGKFVVKPDSHLKHILKNIKRKIIGRNIKLNYFRNNKKGNLRVASRYKFTKIKHMKNFAFRHKDNMSIRSLIILVNIQRLEVIEVLCS